MSISIANDIVPLITEAHAPLAAEFPDEAAVIAALVHDFSSRYQHHVITELGEGTFCNLVDRWIESKQLSTGLRAAITTTRDSILRALVKKKSDTFASQSEDDVLRRSHPLEGRGNGSKKIKKTPAEISTIVMQYAQLAVYIGDTVALDILCDLGILEPGERATAFSCISPYLGETAPTENGNGLIGVLQCPEIILQNMTLREKIHRSLVEYCYHKLLDEDADSMANQPTFLKKIDPWIRKQLGGLYNKAFGQKAGKISEAHAELCEDVVLHFKDAASLQIPETMAKTSIDHKGVEWPLGSWRQRLAIAEMMHPKKRHSYIGFGAGEGKTFTHFWAYELSKAERTVNQSKGRTRLLFFGPKPVINEIPNRVRAGTVDKETDSLYYPNPDDAPTVGVIRKGMTVAQIREAASKDIVFCAYSMWDITRKDTKTRGKDPKETKTGDRDPAELVIADLLINQAEPFTNVSFDEAALLQGDNTYTHLARRTIHGIPNLHAKGHVMFSSATPAPGHLNGLRITLELLESASSEYEASERRTSPPNQWAQLRRMMGKLWMMDRREEWMENIDRQPYQISDRERALLQLIVDDNSMPAQQKLHLSQLIIRCPKLMSSDPTMPWSSFEETTKHIETLLNIEGRKTILVAENILSQSVLWRPDDEAGDPQHYFFDALKSWCDDRNITFHIIHGGTDDDDRIVIFEDMQQAKREGRQCVLFAQSACLNLGIDLRFIDGIISQWPYNTPDLYQLLKRVLRKGNTDCHMIISYAERTVEEGTLTAAELKYLDVLRCFYGVISDDRMAQLSDPNEARVKDESVASTIESPEQKFQRFSRALHGVGSTKTKEFWNLHRDDFIQMLDQKESSSIGDGERAIASIVLQLEKDGLLPERGSYLHTCSSGQRLAYILSQVSPQKSRHICSMDATQEMLDYGGILLPEFIDQGHNIAATLDELNPLIESGMVQAGSQDLVVLQGLNQTSHAAQQDGQLQMTGRVRALRGAVRALKTPDAGLSGVSEPSDGGILLIPIDYDSCTEPELAHFREQLEAFGLEIISTYSGKTVSRDNEGEPPHQMHVITARKAFDPTIADLQSVDSTGLVMTPLYGKESRTKIKERKLPYALPHSEFKIGGRKLPIIPIVDRAERLEYLQRLTQGVLSIQGIASSSKDMRTKLGLKSVQQTLQSMGILCFPQFQPAKKKKSRRSVDHDARSEPVSDERLAFKFVDSPHLFYPFDKQWQKIQQG